MIIFFQIITICLTLIISFSEANLSYAATQTVKITSSDFKNKGFISDNNACDFIGSDKSPQLSFSNLPSGTLSLALIMFDPDAPDKNFVHWIIFNIPANSPALEGDLPKNASLENGIKQGENGTEQIGYFGACPPPGKTHRYIFKIFALDKVLDLEGGATQKELGKAMKSHTIGSGKLVGLYKNKTTN